VSYIVGFSGTRKGMTGPQSDTVAGLLTLATEFHHGDCVGADLQAHAIATQVTSLLTKIVIHPPSDEKLRAYAVGYWSTGHFLRRGGSITTEIAKPYLVRNRDIVNACALLIAAPKEYPEDLIRKGLKGGTWYTYNYANETNTNNIIVFPDGDTEVTTYE
jgi:hypothetical protein